MIHQGKIPSPYLPKYGLGAAPVTVTTRSFTLRLVGIPINLYLPQLLGGGHTQVWLQNITCFWMVLVGGNGGNL